MDSKQVAPTAKRKPPAAGMGRKKGSQNKFTKDVKEMILVALGNAGGADYLLTQAHENPTAFMTLVGKVLPLTVAGDPNAPLAIHVIERRIIKP
ncbi:MAG: hypothetical protein KGH75_09940 [Rhodospirillales bacterium]|nr:hypothetical protein [Rhodospirillales bacterium]